MAEYNISRGHFPGVIFADLFGFQRKEEFKPIRKVRGPRGKVLSD